MKKLLALLLAVAMVFSMVACGGEKKGDDKFEIVVVPRTLPTPGSSVWTPALRSTLQHIPS